MLLYFKFQEVLVTHLKDVGRLICDFVVANQKSTPYVQFHKGCKRIIAYSFWLTYQCEILDYTKDQAYSLLCLMILNLIIFVWRLWN